MRPLTRLRKRQRGAVAIMVGLSAIVLFAFMGIAIDLSYLYVRKTELQNGADAAALSGAKELDQSVAGVANAVSKAIDTFNQNAVDNLIAGFSITIANIRLGTCPHPSDVATTWGTPVCAFVPAASITTDAEAAGHTFLEVHTNDQTKSTFFMRVAGAAFNTTSTYGYAVAGRFVNDVTPIGVCAVDPNNVTSHYTYPTGETELVELGFRRGVAYDIFKLNPLGGSPSEPWLVNPVDKPPGPCPGGHDSANFTAPFVCGGSSAVVTSVPTEVYGNTGLSNSVVKALNSRFEKYSGAYGSNQCDPVFAPPDSNIRQFCFKDGAGNFTGVCAVDPPGAAAATSWMNPDGLTELGGGTGQILPDQQTVSINAPPSSSLAKPGYLLPPANPTPNLSFQNFNDNYGVLWSHSPARKWDAAAPGQVGDPFTPGEANTTTMYNTDAGGPKNYFNTTAYASGFPYSQFVQAPSITGQANRRVLNLLIVDCPNVVSAGSCHFRLPVVGIGKFFMQTMADPTGSKAIQAEFAGLAQPVPLAEIKLYR